MSDDQDYPVGYGRPPKHSRFKPGQSGNPSGRPKAEKTAAMIVAKAASQHVTITENGKRKRTTKFKVAAAQMANQAAGGNLRATKMIFDMLGAPVASAAETAAPSAGVDRNVSDRALLAELARQLRKRPGDGQ